MRMPLLTAPLIAAAATVAAGCASAGAGASHTAAVSLGTPPASPASASPGGAPGSPPPSSPGRAFACGPPAVPAAGHQVLTLTSAQRGKTYCITAGTSVLVLLKGTPGSKWGPIWASGNALRPSANGRMALMIGVTGGSFLAVHPGTSVISSTRPSCPSGAAPTDVPCDPAGAFRVTVIVRGS